MLVSRFPLTYSSYKFANRALVDDSKIFVKKKVAAFQTSAEEEEEERILDEFRYMDLPEEGIEAPNLESAEAVSAKGKCAIVHSSTQCARLLSQLWHSISSIRFAVHLRSLWTGLRSASSTSALYFSSRYSSFQ